MRSQKTVLGIWEGCMPWKAQWRKAQSPGPPSCVFSLLLPSLGGAVKMSWAPMCTVQDAFISYSPKLCKDKSNYGDDDGKQI